MATESETYLPEELINIYLNWEIYYSHTEDLTFQLLFCDTPDQIINHFHSMECPFIYGINSFVITLNFVQLNQIVNNCSKIFWILFVVRSGSSSEILAQKKLYIETYNHTFLDNFTNNNEFEYLEQISLNNTVISLQNSSFIYSNENLSIEIKNESLSIINQNLTTDLTGFWQFNYDPINEISIYPGYYLMEIKFPETIYFREEKFLFDILITQKTIWIHINNSTNLIQKNNNETDFLFLDFIDTNQVKYNIPLEKIMINTSLSNVSLNFSNNYCLSFIYNGAIGPQYIKLEVISDLFLISNDTIELIFHQNLIDIQITDINFSIGKKSSFSFIMINPARPDLILYDDFIFQAYINQQWNEVYTDLEINGNFSFTFHVNWEHIIPCIWNQSVYFRCLYKNQNFFTNSISETIKLDISTIEIQNIYFEFDNEFILLSYNWSKILPINPNNITGVFKLYCLNEIDEIDLIYLQKIELKNLENVISIHESIIRDYAKYTKFFIEIITEDLFFCPNSSKFNIDFYSITNYSISSFRLIDKTLYFDFFINNQFIQPVQEWVTLFNITLLLIYPQNENDLIQLLYSPYIGRNRILLNWDNNAITPEEITIILRIENRTIKNECVKLVRPMEFEEEPEEYEYNDGYLLSIGFFIVLLIPIKKWQKNRPVSLNSIRI
jgi:hypothetical protein